MTADYSLSATQKIIDFLWYELTSKGAMNLGDYETDLLDSPTTFYIQPILPSQQDQLIATALDGKTHIVYDWVADGYEDNWLICKDSMMFTIYSKDPSKIIQIQNVILDAFRRMDESARDLNVFTMKWDNSATRTNGAPGNFVQDTAQSPFIFYSVLLADLLSPEPQREKSGWFAGQAVIRYKYGREVDSSGRFA